MLSWESQALLLILSATLYFYLKRSLNYWEKRNVPFRKSNLIFGNLLELFFSKDNPGRYIGKLYQEFTGPYFGFFALHRPFLVLRDPNIIKRVLVKDFSNFTDRTFVHDEKIDPVLSDALFGIKEPHWRPLRAKISPVFTTGKIKVMLDSMKKCGEDCRDFIKKHLNEDLELKETTSKYTIDVISMCAFGIKANSFENSEFVRAGKLLTNRSRVGNMKMLCYIFAHWLVKLFKFKFMLLEPISFLGNAFSETLSAREKGKFKRNDLIDVIIELKRQESKDKEFKFNINRMIAQGIFFFFAGHETTSSTIAFTLHELCINKVIQDRLRGEILEVIKKHGDLTYEAIQDMKYLQMVVSETIRKYPIAAFLHRECNQDYTIPDTGLVIEKGTPVIISLQGLHRDPTYFPNPEKYDPERFNHENKPKIPAYVYLPFGDGGRICIGKRFGIMSAKVGIIYILKNFKLKRNVHTEEPLIFNYSALLQAKNGIHLTLETL